MSLPNAAVKDALSLGKLRFNPASSLPTPRIHFLLTQWFSFHRRAPNIPTISTPKVSLGLETAETSRVAEPELISKVGEKVVLPNPVELLAAIFARLASILAVFGTEVTSPKVKIAVPVMLDSMATS